MDFSFYPHERTIYTDHSLDDLIPNVQRTPPIPQKIKMQKITTKSGAIYYVHDIRVMGGSKHLIDGKLAQEPEIGHSLKVFTPERHHLNPHFGTAGVISSQIVTIEEITDQTQINEILEQYKNTN